MDDDQSNDTRVLRVSCCCCCYCFDKLISSSRIPFTLISSTRLSSSDRNTWDCIALVCDFIGGCIKQGRSGLHLDTDARALSIICSLLRGRQLRALFLLTNAYGYGIRCHGFRKKIRMMK